MAMHVQMRKFGQTDMMVSPICLGGNTFGWTTDEARSFEVLDAFVDMGGNFIDTADVYSRWAPGHKGGESEVVLGNWCKARNNRESVIIATKVGNAMGDGDQKGLSRKWIMQGVEDSLRRLQTDYIDLYQAHIDDASAPLDETLRAFDELIKAGKVRAIGASNYTGARLTEALDTSKNHGLASYISLQPFYNLAGRDDYEGDKEEVCLHRNIAVIPYSSLASGFLSGKYRPDAPQPTTPRAGGIANRYQNAKGYAVLNRVDAIAKKTGATTAQVAIAWLLHRPSITAPIASATSVPQLRELMGSVAVQLSDADVRALDGVA